MAEGKDEDFWRKNIRFTGTMAAWIDKLLACTLVAHSTSRSYVNNAINGTTHSLYRPNNKKKSPLTGNQDMEDGMCVFDAEKHSPTIRYTRTISNVDTNSFQRQIPRVYWSINRTTWLHTQLNNNNNNSSSSLLLLLDVETHFKT